MIRPLIAPLLAACLAASASALHAQGRDERGGLVLSEGKDVTITVGGYLQADGRFATARGDADPDGVLLRRARLTFDAEYGERWSLRLQPDFGQGRAQLQDGYVAFAEGAVTARVGRFRPAFGVERTQSSATLVFPERSLLNSFMPSRLFGAQATVAGPLGSVTAGAYEAAGVRDALVDTDGDPVGVAQAGTDAALRATLRVLGARRDAEAGDTAAVARAARATRLELQAGVMIGADDGSAEFPGVERYLTPALRPALAWQEGDGEDESTIVVLDGRRRRTTVGALFARGPLHALVEGAWNVQRVRLGADAERLAHGAGAARVTWLWGGTRTPDFEVRPGSRRGAIEAGLRGGVARFDGASARFAEPDAAATGMTSLGAAAAGIPGPLTRVSASVDLTRLSGTARPIERALIVRVQQGF
jgi:hypothetical protein